MLPLSRRNFLLGSMSAAFLASMGPGLAQLAPAAPSLRFSTVAVDVSQLRQKGFGPGADLVQGAMLSALRNGFAPRIGGRGPRLVVVVTSVALNAFAGESNFRSFGSFSSNDYMEGEALVVGPRGEILARYPQLLALPANSGGAWYRPDNEQRRLVALAQTYAAWLQRKVA